MAVVTSGGGRGWWVVAAALVDCADCSGTDGTRVVPVHLMVGFLVLDCQKHDTT